MFYEGCNAILSFNQVILNDMLQNAFIGVVSGLVASITYAIIKALLRPKIDIWDFLCLNEGSDNKKRVIVKLVNRSRVRVVDIECRMQYYSKLSDGGYRTFELPSVYPTQPAIERYVNDSDERNAASLYALQLGYYLDEDIIKLHEGAKFVFSFKGTHALSGTTVYKTVEFPCEKDQYILIDKHFKTGINKGCY